jgi:pimeloyl-ACP methyl ester carboxylesterase
MNRRDLMIASAALALPLPAFAASAEWTPARFHAARKVADLPIGRIAYVERGKGPTAIFLHGYPLNGFQWRGVMARLAAHRRCIAPDLMGLGYSEIPAGTDLSPMAQARMILAFMDQLGIDQADLISNDSATGIAQLIAAEHPQRVRSLLLTNGDVDANSPPPLLMPFIEMCRDGRADAWFKRHYDDRRWARTGDGLANAFRHPETALSDANIEVYFSPIVASSARLKQAREYGIDMLPNPLPAIAPKLKAYPGPVRMVWGDVDLFPPQWAAWLDRTFPNSKGIRPIDDVKLFFPEEVPDLIAEEARKLWGV